MGLTPLQGSSKSRRHLSHTNYICCCRGWYIFERKCHEKIIDGSIPLQGSSNSRGQHTNYICCCRGRYSLDPRPHFPLHLGRWRRLGTVHLWEELSCTEWEVASSPSSENDSCLANSSSRFWLLMSFLVNKSFSLLQEMVNLWKEVSCTDWEVVGISLGLCLGLSLGLSLELSLAEEY